MKKIIYIFTLGVAIAVLLTCFGDLQSYESPSEMNSILILGNRNNQEIEFQKVVNTPDQLIGLWHAENAKTNTYSRLRFNENGTFREDIYSGLNRGKMASIEGSYSMVNDQLTITLGSDEQYRFEFQLVANLLKLRPIVLNN